MPDRILDLRLFRFALASAEYGSIRRAAAALNVQHSTVSKGIRNLEHRVGAELFERHHAGVRLTPAGDRFIKEAVLGFDHLRRAVQHAGDLHRGTNGALTVGLSIRVTLLGDLFERFREEFGGIALEIVESTSSASRALVLQRKVDVAFIANVREPDTNESFHLGEEKMAVVLPRSHPLSESRQVMLEDLRCERILLSASGLGPDIQDHLTRRMAKWGANPMIQLHRANLYNLVSMVARGYGVTIAVGPLTRSPRDDVVLLPLAGRNVLSFGAIWIESNPNPALKGLLDLLRKSPRPEGWR